ncbi:hypothetical protein LIA77_02326 [Sarocladium implicatum]|nr:hypothetical protein LIA77_02326 [Sarocladium implicatum]
MSSVQTWSTFESKDELKKHGLRVSASRVEDEQRGKRTKWLPWVSSNSITSEKGWKPLSMSTPILSALIILTLLLAATIEILAQRSASQGGLALSSSLDEIPRYAMWSYLYAPTVVAVLYSLIWSWVDLDVKRMQPWFELSKEGGATAEGSLFLDYPFDFVAVAPWKAFKRRHWPVVLAGSTMMVVFWLITPLQSAILGTSVITVTEPGRVYMRSRLTPVAEQADKLGTQFLHSGYAVGWLNQSMPSFSTENESYLPFYVNYTKSSPSNSTWTAFTTRFSTELECEPAKETGRLPDGSTYITNDRGCNATVDLNTGANYTMLYIGYHQSPYSDYALKSPNCPLSANSAHQFLAVWAKTPPLDELETTPYNVSAAFCEARYWKQDVRLTVSSQDKMPIELPEPLASRRELTDEEFNRTAFEFMLGNGMPETIKQQDKPLSTVVEQDTRLVDSNLQRPVSNMVGYALAGHVLPTSEYYDIDVLQEAYGRAHRYLFSLAARELMVNETGSFGSQTSNVTFTQSGITVSRTFSAVVEGLLVLVALSTAALLWLVRTAPCYLPQNPSTIIRIGDLLRQDRSFLARLQAVDNADDESLAQTLKHVKLKLIRNTEQSGGISTHLLSFDDWTIFGEKPEASSPRPRFYEPIRPIALRKWAGLLFIVAILAATAFLGYLKAEEVNNNGLARPSDNFEILQLLENYIPTIFATLIEPFWVLLTRLLSMLQPFRDLWKGHAEAKTTIEATYNAIPPQIVAWRALRSRHILLVFLCIMVFLSNLLTVGMGALFNEAPVMAVQHHELRPKYEARFDNTSVSELTKLIGVVYQDHVYVALSNLTYNTRLPPWTSPEFFFQPHMLPAIGTSDGNQSSYTLSTRGFGARGNCTTWPVSEIPVNVIDPVVQADNATVCPNFLQTAGAQVRLTEFSRPKGRSAVEHTVAYESPNIQEKCGMPFNMVFGRTPDAQDMNDTIEASAAMCWPFFETAMFNVTVDASGFVLNATRTGKVETSLDYAEADQHTRFLVNKATSLISANTVEWHNDTLTRNWVSHLLTLVLDSRTFLDPSEPPPDLGKLKPEIEDIYRLLFAILLSLNQQLFQAVESGKAPTTTLGLEVYPEMRIFMDTPAFIISIVVLGINAVVACLFYLRTSAFVLPRMPSTIGSIMAYVAPSRLLWDRGDKSGHTYSFGRYVGKDGKVHLGIETDPHVARIDPASLGPNQNLFSNLLRFRQRGKSKPKGPWL